MKQLAAFLISLLFVEKAISQDTTATVTVDTATIIIADTEPVKDNTRYPSPYKMSFKVDGPIILGGIGLTVLGTHLIDKKRGLTMAEVAAKTKDKVPFFDRSNAGYYSEKADEGSYIPFQYSFALPVVLSVLNKHERHNIVQVLALYVETMSITGTLFTMTAGTIHRSRPYVYGTKASLEKRMEKNSHRSFFAGHTAATASATFFAAKVFQDFNPDSKLKPVIWVVAAATPALVGYLRYKAGMHFLSDNLLGYAIGAGVGILVPELHKNKKLQNFSLTPEFGNNYKGLAITYKIK